VRFIIRVIFLFNKTIKTLNKKKKFNKGLTIPSSGKARVATADGELFNLMHKPVACPVTRPDQNDSSGKESPQGETIAGGRP
jgi:hypothetical protein